MPLSFIVAAASFLAQSGGVDSDPKRTETVTVTVSGDLNLAWIWRSRTLSTARGGFGFYGAGVSDSGRDEGAVEGQLHLRLDVDLTERVRVVLQIDNKAIESSTNPDVIGANPEGVVLFVRQANVRFSEVFHKAVDVTAGVIPWSFDVRGTGHAFFWDPSHSGSMTRHALNMVGGGTGASALVHDELQPTGLLVTYSSETLSGALLLLPAIIEGGSSQQDETGYLLSATYELSMLGRGSRVGAILAVTSHTVGSGAFSDLATLGIEAVIRQFPLAGLEGFTQLYLQRGQVGSIASENIRASGEAVEVGVRYATGDHTPFWVEAKYTYLSGDSHYSGTDDQVEAFLSYENVDDLMIIGDDFLGLNWDTNLRSFLFSAGLSWPDAHLDVQLTLGFCRAARNVTFGGVDSKSLGKEIDLRARWSPNRQITVEAGLAFLLDSDILENMLGGSADGDADDAAALFTLGGKITF